MTHPTPPAPLLTVTMDGSGEQIAAALPEVLAALRELGSGRATVTLTGQELAWAVQRLGLEGLGIESAVLNVRLASPSGAQPHSGETQP